MATIFSAKDIVERSLQKIGRFPTSMAAADSVDLERGLSTLELILQDAFGQQSMIAGKGTLRVPLVAAVEKYPLQYLSNTAGVQMIFDAELIEVASGASTPIRVCDEEQFFRLNLKDVGVPCDIYLNKGPEINPTMQVHPMLGPDVAEGVWEIYLQIQTFATAILTRGVGVPVLNLRPTLYLWAITKLAYELGNGILRRLPETELTRLKADYEEKESKVIGFDGSDNSNQPFTEPWGQ